MQEEGRNEGIRDAVPSRQPQDAAQTEFFVREIEPFADEPVAEEISVQADDCAPSEPEMPSVERELTEDEEPVEADATDEAPTEAPSNPAVTAFSRLKVLFDYIETFCIALSVMIVLFLFVFRYVSVDGDSMLPTLHGGDSSNHADWLITSDLFYTPKTGDIIVINVDNSKKPFIKRVIATEGQQVEINFVTWEVRVDGVPLKEDYINYISGSFMNPADMDALYGIDQDGICRFTVGEGNVFFMGDNRNNSRDSRFIGVEEQSADRILGKVVLRLFPFSEFGTV